MIGQTVYTTFEALDEIFLFQKESDNHRLLYDLVMDYSHVMIDLEKDKFDSLIRVNPFIKALVKRVDKKTYDLKDFFDNLDNDDLSNFPRDLFILNKPKNNCRNLSEKQGILVLSHDDLSGIENLANRNRKSFEKGKKMESNSLKGWQVYFKNTRAKPLNSLIIIDNYILRSVSTGKMNLLNILRGLMPDNLDSEFHILIVTDNRDVKFYNQKLEEIRIDILAVLKKQFNYDIKIGFVTHSMENEFHQRVIITNYHITTSDYGYDCFDTAGIVQKDNEVTTTGAYYTLKHREGDPEINSIVKKLKAVKQLINKNKNISSNVQTNLLVGDFENRLLEF